MLIIDAHCHAGKGDGLTGPWDTRASLKNFIGWANDAGINKINLFAAFHSDYAIANAEVANIVKQNRQKFFGFAFVHAVHDRGRVFELVRKAVEDYGFCGIKVHRHDARISREICETARYFSLPVLYDPVGEVSVIELLAVEYPDVNFIIPHLSSFSDDWRSQIALIPMLEKYKNIYTDTSGVRRFDLLKMAFERAGAGKILFGSDGPWLHPKVELEKIYMLTKHPKELEKMLAGNFLKLTNAARNGLWKNRQQKQPSFKRQNEVLSSEYKDPWLLH